MEKAALVLRITSSIPKGKVLTYKSLALMAGVTPREAGSILHLNKDPKRVPCHRVVSSQGRTAENYAFGGGLVQARNLNFEGVAFNGDQVNIKNFLWRPTEIFNLYVGLLRKYGEPGAWPWFSPGRAHTASEVAFGAILTQNSNWRNAQSALNNLRGAGVYRLSGLYRMGAAGDLDRLKKLVRPSGFYNQKAERLFRFCEFIVKRYLTLSKFFRKSLKTAREELLELNGIGLETADTILLYAGKKPIFVVDDYTKRFAEHFNLKVKPDYESLRNFFEASLPRQISLYQDFHALIVRWGKDPDNRAGKGLKALPHR